MPWLRARLFGAVEDYARGIKVDASALARRYAADRPPNPEALNEALSGAALFQPEDTPEQKAALARLETVLALVEGWVSTVVEAAARDRLPQADALAEAIRRRRATGGPAERTFATLVGLELRPRRLREAAAIWQGLTHERGVHRARRASGHTRTCCRPPTTSTTPTASCAASRSLTSRPERRASRGRPGRGIWPDDHDARRPEPETRRSLGSPYGSEPPAISVHRGVSEHRGQFSLLANSRYRG